jgi:hypothetical protein
MSSLVGLLPLEPATSASEWSYAACPDGTTLSDHGKALKAEAPYWSVIRSETSFSWGNSCRTACRQSVDVLGFWANWKRRVLNRGRRIHREHGLRVHHALDDARVNRLVLTR